MNKSLAFLTAAVLPLLFVAPAAAEVKVFLLAGQSNMLGEGGYPNYMAPNQDPWTLPPYNVADAPCPAPYNQPLDAVKFWNYNPDVITNHSHSPGIGNGWISLQNGYGNRDDEFGPELSFGATLKQLYPNDEIYLVKYAVGGTNLAVRWNPYGYDGSNDCYTMFKSRVTAALDNLVNLGKAPVVAGMVWMQGEDDSTNQTSAEYYGRNLKNLIMTVRSTFNNAQNMKFVAGRITYMSQRWSTKERADLVRNAQWNIGTQVSNASCVNTDDLQWAFYGHYGTQGQIDLGTRFANEFPGSPIPEPSTLVMVGTGLFCFFGYVWRKRK